MDKYPKGSAWKRGHWDKWGFWRKVLHIIQVIIGVIMIITMFLATAYIVLVIFGLYGFLLYIRDTILLGLMHLIFG